MSIRKKVLIVGQLASFAGAGPLAKMFNSLGDWDVELVVSRPDNLDFSGLYNAHVLRQMGFLSRIKLRAAVRDADLTIIAGTPGIDTWMRLLALGRPNRTAKIGRTMRQAKKFAQREFENPIALLVTDSHILIHPDELNKIFSYFPSMKIFAMPDLIPFIRRDEVLPFYPGTGTYEEQQDRSVRRNPLVGHSPSKKERFHQKGTQRVLDAFAKLELDYDLISGLPYFEALARKSKLDIFVDQVAPADLFPKTTWHGGVGKSGLEAMALGCAVVTSGTLADTEPHMPLPPVLMTDEDRFETDLKNLAADPTRVAEMGRLGKAWYETYATTESQVRFILQHTGFTA